MTGRSSWSRVLAEMPLVAILRGIEPRSVIAIAEVLENVGIRCLEIPLNSPNALESVEKVRSRFDGKLLVGAGTVLNVADVISSKTAGAEFIVSPNTDASVIDATKARDLISIPGFSTPTEGFTAIAAGADALKLFPAESTTPSVLRALRAVIPKAVPILPVGGIQPGHLEAWREAGAAGVGIGSALYVAGESDARRVQERAVAFVEAWQAPRNSSTRG